MPEKPLRSDHIDLTRINDDELRKRRARAAEYPPGAAAHEGITLTTNGFITLWNGVWVAPSFPLPWPGIEEQTSDVFAVVDRASSQGVGQAIHILQEGWYEAHLLIYESVTWSAAPAGEVKTGAFVSWGSGLFSAVHDWGFDVHMTADSAGNTRRYDYAISSRPFWVPSDGTRDEVWARVGINTPQVDLVDAGGELTVRRVAVGPAP